MRSLWLRKRVLASPIGTLSSDSTYLHREGRAAAGNDHEDSGLNPSAIAATAIHRSLVDLAGQ
ncbi:hypothetical protein AVEN_227033-1, partial [Araneus ventricosus]